MTTADELAVIECEGRHIISFGRGAPERMVIQYPTWTLRDLVVHVAGVHGRTAEVCRTLTRGRIPTPALPDGQDPFDWAAEQLELMLDGLRTADVEAEVWTFVPSKRMAFWGPRMLIETGVHRWDAQGVVEDPEPLLPMVAASGLDEFSALYLPQLGTVPTIALTATDLGRTWHFGEGEAAAPVEGPASDLFLRLMSRPGTPLPAEWERAVDALGSPADRRLPRASQTRQPR